MYKMAAATDRNNILTSSNPIRCTQGCYIPNEAERSDRSHSRNPVYDAAASVTAGISIDKILSSSSNLKQEQVELAFLYAKANPQRGRPRQRPARPHGATIHTKRRRLIPKPA
jgi:hypothetical protein